MQVLIRQYIISKRHIYDKEFIACPKWKLDDVLTLILEKFYQLATHETQLDLYFELSLIARFAASDLPIITLNIYS